jgi:hypothetical protein
MLEEIVDQIEILEHGVDGEIRTHEVHLNSRVCQAQKIFTFK